MAATGACFVAGGSWSVFRRDMKSATGGLGMNPVSVSVSTRPFMASIEQTVAPGVEEKGGIKKKFSKRWEEVDLSEVERPSLQDYFERSKDLIRSDGGPPRWFSPLECGTRLENSPLLLYLPGFSFIYFLFLVKSFFCGKLLSIIQTEPSLDYTFRIFLSS